MNRVTMGTTSTPTTAEDAAAEFFTNRVLMGMFAPRPPVELEVEVAELGVDHTQPTAPPKEADLADPAPDQLVGRHGANPGAWSAFRANHFRGLNGAQS